MRSLAEWLVAGVVVAGAVWVVTPLVRGLAPPGPGAVTLVESDLPALPRSVPAEAESLPLLMLESGFVLRVGMLELEASEPPLSRLSAGPAETEPGVFGDRIILPFRTGPSRFWVVLERTEERGERTVTAIYVR